MKILRTNNVNILTNLSKSVTFYDSYFLNGPVIMSLSNLSFNLPAASLFNAAFETFVHLLT